MSPWRNMSQRKDDPLPKKECCTSWSKYTNPSEPPHSSPPKKTGESPTCSRISRITSKSCTPWQRFTCFTQGWTRVDLPGLCILLVTFRETYMEYQLGDPGKTSNIYMSAFFSNSCSNWLSFLWGKEYRQNISQLPDTEVGSHPFSAMFLRFEYVCRSMKGEWITICPWDFPGNKVDLDFLTKLHQKFVTLKFFSINTSIPKLTSLERATPNVSS